jgi:hypothetical protein
MKEKTAHGSLNNWNKLSPGQLDPKVIKNNVSGDPV